MTQFYPFWYAYCLTCGASVCVSDLTEYTFVGATGGALTRDCGMAEASGTSVAHE